jgi:hypothetical protein
MQINPLDLSNYKFLFAYGYNPCELRFDGSQLSPHLIHFATWSQLARQHEQSSDKYWRLSTLQQMLCQF